MSNPITSQDLYQPGSEDQLKLLHARLVQLQGDMKNMTTLARSLKTSLSGININNGSAQKQIVELAQKVERLNQELEKTKQAHQRTQQQIERTRAAEQNRLTASIRAEDALTRAIDNQNERRAASTRKQKASDQALDQKRIASEERRLAQSIKAEGALSREIDKANERRAASTRKQKASDQALDQKRIASAQRVADNQRRINAGIQSNAQKTAAAIANMNELNNARVQSISQSRQISQARANAQAAIQAQRLTIAQNQAAESALRLQRAQQSAAESAKRHSGSLRGLLSSLRSITYAYFSLAAAQQIVGKLFSETKQLNTLDIAMRQTLGTMQEVAAAQEFLVDISTRYGADLLTTSNAYLKFGTAAKQAGVSSEETKKIFESVTKASSVLGLGAERTSYVFLALEQIMSKGRLSTEELRRQLGEHLPGAFGIAAQAMGVTTEKLTDMLKKGQIASTDFLPKFAKQLELTYGIANVQRVDNLAAAQGRFNNEITLLIRKINVSQSFKAFFNTLTEGVKFISSHISTIATFAKVIIQLGTAWLAWRTAMAATNALQSVSTGLIGRAIRMQGLFSVATTLAGRAMASLNAIVRANPLGVFLSAVILLYPQLQKLADSIMGVTEGMRAMEDSLDQLRDTVFTETEGVRKQIGVLKDLNSTQQQRLDAFNALQEAYPGILQSYKLEETSLDNLITLERQLTDAIVDRAKASSKADITKQLLSDLEEANRAVPFGLFLNSKESAAEQTKNYRENLKNQAYKLAQEKLDALEIASYDLNRFLQDNIKITDNLEEKEALRLKYRQKEVELQKEMIKLSNEELQKIIDTKAATGRSFGQADPYLLLKKNIASNILSSRVKPSGGGDGGEGGKQKDPRLILLEYQDDLNKLKEDGLAKDLETLRISYEKEKIMHETQVEYLLELDKWYQREHDKLVSNDAEKSRDDLESKGKAIAEVFESLRKLRVENLKQGRDEAEEYRKNSVEKLKTEFDQRRDHEKEIFELSKHTKEEEKAFAIKQKIEELNDIIQLHRTFGKVLNDEELARAIDLRDSLKKVITKDGRLTGGLDTGDTTDSTKPADLFDLLHINLDDNQKDAIKSSFEFAKDQLSSFLDFQKEIAQQEVDLANEKVRQAEDNLNRQVALAAAGQANNVAEAQAQLALAKKTQEEALKQRKKAQKTELALNTALEASNLGVAIAKTLAAGLGVAGIGLVALMLGAFAAAKIKAFQLANKQTFRKGAYREIGGGSHESGNDTHVGGNNWAEKNESVGIFNAKATRKYKPTLKMFVDAANRGTLDNIIVRDQRMTRGLTSMNVNMDTSKMEKSLVKLVDIGEKKTMVSPNGDLIIVDRGRTTRIKRYGIG